LNYAALLGVIAAASFAAPLLTRLAVGLGLSDAAFAPVSLLVAAAMVSAWLAADRGDEST